jgi:XTP/dITP diphosphohydrolase
MAELKEAEALKDKEQIENEFGDVMFALINYARWIGINPENALEKTNKKFINRFQHMENAITKNKQNMSDMTLNELDVYWEKAKEKDL